MNNFIQQFRDAIQRAGVVPPETIEADGRLHRFSSSGKHGDDAGWYVLHGAGIPAGSFGDWRSGLTEYWRADIGRELTDVEMVEHKARIQEQMRTRKLHVLRQRSAACEIATSIWEGALSAPTDHPYLVAKGIQPFGLRIHEGRLVVPMRDADKVCSLQFIAADGDKRFLPGGQVRGCYHVIGSTKDAKVLCIVEGAATGASVHMATGHPVAVAFNAGNLLSVAEVLRAKTPNLSIIVCADDDYKTDGNPGLTKAREAANAIGAKLAVPEFGADRPERATDFNDLHKHKGIEAVRQCFESGQAEALSGVVLIRGDEITPEPISWLWDGWLACGKLHILAGAPGTGKTTLTLALAAAITTSGLWPDGTNASLGNVVMWSGEDDPADTLVPRLLAMNADMRRIHFLDSYRNAGGVIVPFDPAVHMAELDAKMSELSDVRLLIVDPVVSAITGDSHKNTEVRRALQPLVDFGNRHRCAVLGISHFSKGSSGRDPTERVVGSIAFGAVARVVMAAAKRKDESGNESRILVRSKSNIGPDNGGYCYELEQVEARPNLFASRVLWGDPVDGEARELLGSDTDDDTRSAVSEAMEWLQDFLSNGVQPQTQVMAHAAANGLTRKTLRNAKERLGVQSTKSGMKGGWEWTLPEGAP
jgi:putative DNA primase/helicase